MAQTRHKEPILTSCCWACSEVAGELIGGRSASDDVYLSDTPLFAVELPPNKLATEEDEERCEVPGAAG